jgi:hypothetical protein
MRRMCHAVNLRARVLRAANGPSRLLLTTKTTRLPSVSSTLAGAFGIAALFVAVLALVFAIQALRAQRDPATQVQPLEAEPEAQPSAPEGKPGTVKSELRRLSKELDVTKLELTQTLQHLAVVRYDAYGEMSGRLSWSLAVVNDNGNGVVLTSINGRNDARSYAKEVKGFASESKLSPEEAEAIETLRVKASPALGDPDHQ